MIEEIFKELASYGVIGVLLAWLIWKDTKFTNRIFKVIENNTEAMTKLRDTINNLERVEK